VYVAPSTSCTVQVLQTGGWVSNVIVGILVGIVRESTAEALDQLASDALYEGDSIVVLPEVL